MYLKNSLLDFPILCLNSNNMEMLLIFVELMMNFVLAIPQMYFGRMERKDKNRNFWPFLNVVCFLPKNYLKGGYISLPSLFNHTPSIFPYPKNQIYPLFLLNVFAIFWNQYEYWIHKNHKFRRVNMTNRGLTRLALPLIFWQACNFYFFLFYRIESIQRILTLSEKWQLP